MMTSRVNLAIAVTFGLFLTACAGSGAIQDNKSGDTDTTAGTTGSEAQGQGLGRGTQAAKAGQRPDKLLVKFEYDSSALDGESRGIIEQHAAYLAAHPNTKIRLAGYADERGTREYNLALGERRSGSVERILRVLGINGDRLAKVSYGEEQPLAMGHDETSWKVNRRVEFVYLN